MGRRDQGVTQALDGDVAAGRSMPRELGGGAEGGPRGARGHAVAQVDPVALGGVPGQRCEALVVDPGLVGEERAESALSQSSER